MPPRSNPIGPAGRRIAAAVFALRQARGMTKTQLSHRVTALGRSMSLDVITEIEKTARALDIDDVITLARALNVPPILLIFPVGQESHCELAPDDPTQETWACVQWFTGQRPYSPVPGKSEWNLFNQATASLNIYQEYSRYIEKWKHGIRRTKVAAAVTQIMGEEKGRQEEYRATQEIHEAETLILDARTRLMEMGYPLPSLPQDGELREHLAVLQELEHEIHYTDTGETR